MLSQGTASQLAARPDMAGARLVERIGAHGGPTYVFRSATIRIQPHDRYEIEFPGGALRRSLGGLAHACRQVSEELDR